jgi:hypothetical protein
MKNELYTISEYYEMTKNIQNYELYSDALYLLLDIETIHIWKARNYKYMYEKFQVVIQENKRWNDIRELLIARNQKNILKKDSFIEIFCSYRDKKFQKYYDKWKQ